MSPKFAPHPDRRVAAVSGASSGIGAATARALAAAGHAVVLGARRVELCEEIAAEICADGGEAVAARLDVTDPASVKDFAAAAAELGDVDVLVSSAGDVLLHSSHGVDPADFAAQVDLNLVGAQRLVSQFVPAMVERRRGDVVLVTSDSVRLPRPLMSAYVASKWGLEGMARTLQMELEGTGVRASIVRPGPTLTGMGSTWTTEMLQPAVDAWLQWGLARHGNFLAPEHMAAAVLAAVSMPRGAHVTLIEVEPEAPIRSEEQP
ncbi:MAG TPA: SDR family oxidoreductase [Acidimicrobiales bacterium]|nr:SDR family oxidoreductase [Acidimicrobiales bacterium]